MTNIVDIVRLPGDYKIVTQPGGNLTLDVGYTTNPLDAGYGSTGTVTIYGNLDVRGITSQIETRNTEITDNEIVLNAGTSSYTLSNLINGGTAGLRINRGGGNYDGRLIFDDSNDKGRWRDITGTDHYGLWRTQSRETPTVFKAAGFYLDPLSISGNTLAVNSTGQFDGNPRLVLIGDRPETRSAVVSVKGTLNYHLNVRDDDDIPNKKYVDQTIGSIGVNTATYAQMLVNNNGGIEAPVPESIDGYPLSYISISRVAGGGVGRISMYIDDYLTMDVGPESVQLAELAVNGSSITPFHTGTNIYLVTNGGAEVVVNSALTYQVPDAAPQYAPNQVKVYSTSTVGQGGTGLLFVNGNQTRDELVSAKKALIFSIIF